MRMTVYDKESPRKITHKDSGLRLYIHLACREELCPPCLGIDEGCPCRIKLKMPELVKSVAADENPNAADLMKWGGL